MLRICTSVEFVTQHRHFYEKEVSVRRKTMSQQGDGKSAEKVKGISNKNGEEPIKSYNSAMGFSEMGKKNRQCKGLQLTQRSHDKTKLKQDLEISFGAREVVSLSSLNIPGPQSTKAVPRKIVDSFFKDSFIFEREKKVTQIPTLHQPHPLISRKREQKLSQNRFIMEGQDLRSKKVEPCSKPNIEIFFQQKDDEKLTNISSYGLRRTRKRQPVYDPRHSEDTLSNNNSQAEKFQEQDLRRGCIFAQDKMTININKIDSKHSSKLMIPPSPSKFKTMLDDAKSIISRQASVSRFEDLQFQESFMVEREADTFSFITPVEGLSGCQMAKAIDRRHNTFVTLKFFKNENECYPQLNLIKLVDGLGQGESRMLKFQHVLMEDHQNRKKIIFVFEPFQTLLSEEIGQRKSKRENMTGFISKLKAEVKIFLNLLSINGIMLKQALKLEDFVYTSSGWRLHSLSKFKLDLNTLSGDVSRWVQGLSFELSQVIL